MNVSDARLDELIAGRMFVAEEARDALRSYRSLRARHKEAVGLLRDSLKVTLQTAPEAFAKVRAFLAQESEP